jgi:hypothetical protein
MLTDRKTMLEAMEEIESGKWDLVEWHGQAFACHLTT